jgi:hypothetical protein
MAARIAMRIEVANRLIQLHQPVAAKRPAGDGLLGWVGVYRLSPPRVGYRVLSFDVPAAVIANDWDAAGELHNEREVTVASLEDVDRAVEEMGAHADDLDAPWRVDYPL